MARLLTYVVTHKPVEWVIPFPHKLVTVGEYWEPNALNTCESLSPPMNTDRALAWFRFIPSVLAELEALDDSVGVVAVNHRTAFSAILREGLSKPVWEPEYRICITPEQLYAKWDTLVMTEFPDNADLVVTNVIDLGRPHLKQYSQCHHLDDLLLGMSMAIRLGMVTSSDVEWFLNSRFFIGFFAARKPFFKAVYSKAWELGVGIFEKFPIQRRAYQERYINFVLERFVALLLFKEISKKRMRVMSTKILLVDPDLTYKRSE